MNPIKKNQPKFQTASIAAFMFCLMLLNTQAFAHEPGAYAAGYGPLQEFSKRNPDFKEQADLNGDGQIDRAERRQARQALREKWLENHPEAAARIDANGDGTIDETERRRAREYFSSQRDERRDMWLENHPRAENRLDRNDNGQIDPREWKQGNRFKNWADKNNDGQVGSKERHYVKNTYDRLDQNNDGQINRAEKRRAHEVRSNGNGPGPRGPRY